MKNKGQWTLALSLALITMLTLGSCAFQKNTDAGNRDLSPSPGAQTLFDKKPNISIVVQSHSSWPYNEDWLSWQYIREATGANLDITAIPATDFVTKVTLMMADSKALPDLIYLDNKKLVDKYALTGAFIAIDEYIDKAPNYTKFWGSIPEEEREMRLTQRKAADGKTYYPQNYGTDSRQGIRAWLYRKDVFEKNNLSVPETMDEVYLAAKQLKELYPQSYPLCLREGLRNIGVMGSQWKPNFTYGLYYDFDNKKWCYGASELTMREIVEFMRKMYEEGLLPPDYLKINVRTWEELISTDRGFLMPDFVVRVDNFNAPNRKLNPDYTIAAMIPPRAHAEGGQSLMNKFNVDPKGYAICNTGVKERIENAVTFIDWMYSDEAAELLGWGKEGETYEIKDGRKQFIRPEEGDIEGEYGLFSYGTYLRVDPDAASSIATDEQAESVKLALEYTEKSYNPAYWMAFDDEDSKLRDSLDDAITTYTEEGLSKFLYNQEPMTKWDSFVQELKDMGLDDLLTLYEKAYNALIKPGS